MGTTASGRHALELTQSLKPDFALLDIRMSDMDGLQVLAAIKATCPATSVIILTGYAYPEYLSRAITLGVGGFVSKEVEPEQILRTIIAVTSGDAIVDKDLLKSAMQIVKDAPRSSPGTRWSEAPTLTQQEDKVLRLVAEGLDNDSIARILSVCRNTVKTHTRHIFSKLGVADRTQAAIWAYRHGMAAP